MARGGGARGGGKRFASSGSSLYYVTTSVFAALCIVGVWWLSNAPPEQPPSVISMATSSSSAAKVASRSAHREVVIDDPQAELAEHVTRGSSQGQGHAEHAAAVGRHVAVQEKFRIEAAKEEMERRMEVKARQDQQDETGQEHEQEVEEEAQEGTGGGDEQEKTGQEEEQQGAGAGGATLDGGMDEETRMSKQEQRHEQEQREHDEQMPTAKGHVGGVEESQSQESANAGTSSGGEQEEPQQENSSVGEGAEEGGETGLQQPQVEKSEQAGGDDGGEGEKESSETKEEKATENAGDGTGGGDDQQGDDGTSTTEPNAGDSMSGEGHSEVSGDGSDEEQTRWATQADHSEKEKGRMNEEEAQSGNDLESSVIIGGSGGDHGGNGGNAAEMEWKLCNVKAGADYIPCLDNEKAIKKLRPENFHHYEHRERHCPDEGPTCLVPLPAGYKRSIEWPKSRERIWYSNVPHKKLAEVKGHQNWVKVSGQYLMFPGGGTQFIHGALHYIDFLQQSVRGIAWGKHTRVILDVGCGVASFGGYLFDRDVLAMSFAPKDEHEAQVQFALERGVPAISSVMGSKRLSFPSKVFDAVHCARCRVPWHVEGGTLLLELNRVLRPGGYFIWSATPVYQKLEEDVEIWKAMMALTKSMCWELVTIKKDRLNGVGAAFFQKPTTNNCYESRKQQQPPMCNDDDDPNAAWYVRLNACMHRVPTDQAERGTVWPEEWPKRLRTPPYWMNTTQPGVYGKPGPEDFVADSEHWKRVIRKSYLSGFGIDWTRVRNVMDMRAVYGGFAAALKDEKVWVMNVVNIDAPDTLPVIFERGLFGIYHDWCESFSTYPRTYDLLHADHLFSKIKERCAVQPVVVEVDRIVRPGGKLIVRDESEAVVEVESLLKSLHWEVRLTFSKNQQSILCAKKTEWRPEELAEAS